MTLMYESERYDLLQAMDVFAMAKLMHDEKINMQPVSYHSYSNQLMLLDCLTHLSKYYPFFKVRESKSEDITLIFTVSLPPQFKNSYKEFKTQIRKIFDADEAFYYGENYTLVHYNEIHYSGESSIELYQILHNLINYFKTKMEGLK